MIGKVTDTGTLSGVSSPLLPLIYCDFHSSVNETDGVYVQTVNGERTLVFSLRNGAVTLACASDNWDKDEFFEFVKFTRVGYITADFKFDDNCTSFCLMEGTTDNDSDDEATAITPESSSDEYRKIHALLGDKGDDFNNWYASFSAKINKGNAAAVYVDDFCSCAVCTAVLGDAGVIAGVYTKSESRGKGYGKRAVCGLLGVMRNAGLSKALLWCENNNISFYKKTGFIPVGEIFYSEVI